MTTAERITDVVLETDAHRNVIEHVTASVQATRARTRIGALLIYACPITNALLMDYAFGPAVGRCSYIGRKT